MSRHTEWTGSYGPDPLNKQYPVMVAAIQRVARELRGAADLAEALSSMLIWVDYSSIPQATRDSQKAQALAIQALSAYSSCASAFIIVAPRLHHADTGALCDFTTYQSRMWTRAEQFCHVLRNGVGCMWKGVDRRRQLQGQPNPR